MNGVGLDSAPGQGDLLQLEGSHGHKQGKGEGHGRDRRQCDVEPAVLHFEALALDENEGRNGKGDYKEVESQNQVGIGGEPGRQEVFLIEDGRGVEVPGCDQANTCEN